MKRIVVDVSKGTTETVDLTPEEIADAQARTAEEDSTAWLRAIVKMEFENPITHRAQREETLALDYILRLLREKINALDAEVAALAARAPGPLPDLPETHLVEAVRALDDLIKVERAKR